MVQTGEGTGTLVPTGKSEPVRGVKYAITHEVMELNGPGNQTLKQQQAIVKQISCLSGERLPLGDFDLVVGSEFIRLKHISQDPEWLVLSSNA